MAAGRQSVALWGSLLRAAHRRSAGASDTEFLANKTRACYLNDASHRRHDPDAPPPSEAPLPEPPADGMDWGVEAQCQRRVGPLTGVNYENVQQARTSLRGTTAQPSGPESIAGGNVLRDAMPAPPGAAPERSGAAAAG